MVSAGTMHQYVVGLATLKTMMCVLSDELDRGSRVVYLDVMEARVRFQKDFTIEYTDTIADYQAWNQFANVDHHEDVEEMVFPQLSGHSDVLNGFLKPIFSHMGTCAYCM